ncbi:DHH family phosphoesterase [Candidatus Woesearchaeota archaeon]|nr:DHH family phosphoesterase [Candidatus Woesearchaeota archaeon]
MTLQSIYKHIKEEIDECAKPLFFFDNDPDGLTSFLLLYRYKKEGHGVVIKTRPRITTEFVRKVNEYEPDKIFILDIAQVDQEFLDQVNVPVVWIDHHPVERREKVLHLNPRLSGETPVPTSYMCYQAVRQDLWIAMIGSIADWYVPDFKDQFCEHYPGLADPILKEPAEYLFTTKLGELIRIFSFNLKGSTTDALKSIKIMSRISSPEEILEQQTGQGKFLYKKYERIEKDYQALKKVAIAQEKKTKKDPFLVFIYEEDNISLTKDLSNELLYLFPKKIIVLGRRKSGEIKCSLRCSGTYKLNIALEKALMGIQGYGGGHDYACGCCIKEEEFPSFLENFKKALDL